EKVEDDKKFDGIFVLRTNTDLNPLEAMLCSKQLWTVEQTFRTAKHLLSTRPIFHKLDATIRGHVFCSLLALVLKKALEDRIASLARSGSRAQILPTLHSAPGHKSTPRGHPVGGPPPAAPRPPPPPGRGRRRPPAAGAGARAPLIPPIARLCSATPPSRCGLLLQINY